MAGFQCLTSTILTCFIDFVSVKEWNFRVQNVFKHSQKCRRHVNVRIDRRNQFIQ